MNGLQVHSHSYVTGPRSHGGCYLADGQWHSSTFSHSHPGGDHPHEHPDTGPASYVIDKDEWFRATGLPGGGRKKFTTKPTGERLRYLPRRPATFEIVVCDPPKDYLGEGPGLAPAARLVLGFKMRPPRVIDRRTR
jgi:hypothetical protein